MFTDDDGQDYLVFSYRSGRGRTYVAKINDTDSLTVEPATQIFSGAGREGNAMFKLDGQYYIAAPTCTAGTPRRPTSSAR